MASPRPAAFKLDGFLAAGLFLALWAATNTVVDILRYGWDQGYYWWFCNLALTGTAYGCLRKDRGWLTGFLSIACFTQVVWIIDNIARSVFQFELFGLVEFMYQPGMPLTEFLLSHYHYVTIPVSIMALLHLPARPNNSLRLVLFWNPFIFAVSYFAFPREQNVNCIHEPCFPALSEWGGPWYALGFWLLCYAIHIFLVVRIDRFFLGLPRNEETLRKANRIFAGVAVAVLALTTIDIRYKASLPSFRCTAAQPSGAASIHCRYTLDYDPGVMLMTYEVRNRGEEPLACQSAILANGRAQAMHGNLLLEKESTAQKQILLVYPRNDVTARLTLTCQPAPEVRLPASPQPERPLISLE